MNITDLVREGVLTVAALPLNNWRDVEHAPFITVPLIAEDYPARTAAMWNAAYERFGIADKNTMMLAHPESVSRILDVFRQDPRYRGGGAGVGFKEVVMQHLDDVTPMAKAMGAVNIIKKVGDRLVGDNTDGEGFAQSLAAAGDVVGVPLQGMRVLMLGAGGTGRAIAFALADKGAQLTILNRTEKKAHELAASVNEYISSPVAKSGGRELIPEVLSLHDAVVSVVDDAHSPVDEYSPLGDMELPITPASIERNRTQTAQLLAGVPKTFIVSDIRIRKTETPMLAEARRAGLQVLDGIPMVINQGVTAFWWLYGEALKEKGVTFADVQEVMQHAV